MKKQIILLVLLSAGASLQAMNFGFRPAVLKDLAKELAGELYAQGRNALLSPFKSSDSEERTREKAIDHWLSCTKNVPVEHIDRVIKEYKDLFGSVHEFINVQGPGDGRNILHGLASLGVKHGDPTFDYLVDLGVNLQAKDVDGDTVEDFIKGYEKGWFENDEKTVEDPSEPNIARQLFDGEPEEPAPVVLEPSEVAVRMAAQAKEAAFTALVKTAAQTGDVEQLIGYQDSDDAGGVDASKLGQWLEKYNNKYGCHEVMFLVAFDRSNTDRALRDVVYATAMHMHPVKFLEHFFSNYLTKDQGNVDVIPMDNVEGDFTIRTWLEHLQAYPALSNGMPIDDVLEVVNRHRPKVEKGEEEEEVERTEADREDEEETGGALKGEDDNEGPRIEDNPVHDENPELDDKKASSLFRYAFWTTVSLVVAGFVYKKFIEPKLFFTDERRNDGGIEVK